MVFIKTLPGGAGKVIAVDAKLNFDDNAKYRQRDVFAMEDVTESDPREVEAAKFNLNYIGMTGNIGYLIAAKCHILRALLEYFADVWLMGRAWRWQRWT